MKIMIICKDDLNLESQILNDQKCIEPQKLFS